VYHRAVLRCSVGLLAILCVPTRAGASSEDLFGQGAAAPAFAGGGAALVRGAAAVHANPALLDLRRERSLTFGFEFHLFDATLDHRDHVIDPVRGAIIGVTLPLPFLGVLRDRLTLGMSFFVPAQVVVRGDILFSDDPQFLLLESRGQSVAIQLGLGGEVTDWLSLGAGFRALAELVGTVRLTADAAGKLGSRVEDQLVATYAPLAGAHTRFGPFEAGLTVRGELSGRIDVDVISEETPVPLPNLNIAGLAQYDPFEVALELAWGPRPRLSLAAGATYERWSAYDGPLEQTNQNGPAPANPSLHDVVAPHFSIEWTPGQPDPGNALTVRGGLGLEPTPVPPATEQTRIYDSARVKIGVGLGLTIDRPPVPPLRFDLYAQEQVLVPRTHDEGTRSAGSILSMGGSVGVTF
jgi:long-chain fatty acid transport protein